VVGSDEYIGNSHPTESARDSRIAFQGAKDLMGRKAHGSSGSASKIDARVGSMPSGYP
jgi:hypothetical protein